MGGKGSGRRRRPEGGGPRTTTDELPALDVRALKREGVIALGDEELILRHRRLLLVQSLALAWTPCGPHGGSRPWFVCPGERCGGRRAAILYTAADGRLLCRVCLGLSYPSQRA